MCFTTNQDGQRYYQIFGVFSPPRLINNDDDQAALRRLCRAYFYTFSVGSLLMAPVLPVVPVFWAILTAWYYDKARRLSQETNLPRPPLRLVERLRDDASRQSIFTIAARMWIWLVAAFVGFGLARMASCKSDLVLVGVLLAGLSLALVWAQSVKLIAKLERMKSS